MTADEAKGGPFDGEPSNQGWVKCPECGGVSQLGELREGSVDCDTCGWHSAILCPKCDTYIDSITQDSWVVIA